VGLTERVRAMVDAVPSGASVTLPVDTLRAWLDAEPDQPFTTEKLGRSEIPNAASWRTLLWSCPESTRLGVPELCEALGRGRDWVYRAANAEHAAERGRDPLPCKRLDGVLVFEAGAVRRWLNASEVIENPEPKPRLKAG
jgi:hypothetical protein